MCAGAAGIHTRVIGVRSGRASDHNVNKMKSCIRNAPGTFIGPTGTDKGEQAVQIAFNTLHTHSARPAR